MNAKNNSTAFHRCIGRFATLRSSRSKRGHDTTSRTRDWRTRVMMINNGAFGLGLGFAPDYEGSEDYQAVPLWLVRYENIYHPATFAQLFATKFTSNFIADKNWRLGPTFDFVRKRDDVDNDRVDDLNSASESFLVGVIGGYDFVFPSNAIVGAEIDARVDVANDNGYLITPKLKYEGKLAQRWFINSGLSTTYASGDYMSNYFGIDAADAARSGLDEYDADASFKDISLDAAFTYAINENWTNDRS